MDRTIVKKTTLAEQDESVYRKILFIADDDPKLTGCGTQIRTHFLYEALKRLGEVVVFVPTKGRKVGFRQWLFRGLTKVGCCGGGRLSEDIGQTDGFDAVVVRYARNAAEFEAWKIAPLYLDIDDVPSQAFEIEKHRLPWWARGFAALLVRVWQRRVFAKCRGCWVVKREDADYLPQGVEWDVLRNIACGGGGGKERSSAVDEKTLLSVGYLGHGPNAEGVEWFLREIWPQFKARHPAWSFEIAGKGATPELQRLCAQAEGVKLLGFVDGLDAVYARASAVVAPILSGAGSCVKVAESALHGKVTYVTPCAIRGIEPQDADALGFRVFENAEEFLARFAAPAAFSADDIRSAAERYNSFDAFAERVKHALDRGNGKSV